ncbi:MAG: hypothetical protein CMC07_02250 [Flavobacteriaceae bacterium]|nr:hypothetical protein [Flavobacteriaceae bacterium]|tara:strand:+ start:35 stop:502 length:468 start_codon:yes stop_codon:yes gene_type:complete
MKKIYTLLSIIILFSCQPKKTETEIIKDAFTLLLKENTSQQEIQKYYKFPFFNDRQIYENPKEFLEWKEKNFKDKDKAPKVENLEIIDSYSFNGFSRDDFKNNDRYEDLKRILTLNKENSKILEVVFNKKDFLKNGGSFLVLYDTNSNKIFGFED